MSKNNILDFVILGGGCSALSFINQVIEQKITKYSFIIIEKQKKYVDDKSWCFWSENIKKNKNIIEASWSSFSFNLGNSTNFLSSINFKYYYIRSIKFYESIKKKISNYAHITLRLNETIISITNKKNYYEVITNKNIYLAKNILDTRPNINIFEKKPFLYQCLVGYEIKSAEKINLKKSNAYLMHNMHASNNKFFFEYILPIEKNTYLFELTTFTKKDLSLKIIEKELRIVLSKYFKKPYKIIRKEYGKIPMGFVNNKIIKNKKNYFVSGSLAGSIRPSSGYAFIDIQKWSERAANNLKIKGNIETLKKPEVIKMFLDKIFLKVISSDISKAPQIFYYFSKNISPITFIKFMLGEASLLEYLKVIYAMPKRIFLKCLIKI
tara:strand:- start:704 stop:1846 length:1143 start_codon:yes stop_codon:yes gene_type:complete